MVVNAIGSLRGGIIIRAGPDSQTGVMKLNTIVVDAADVDAADVMKDVMKVVKSLQRPRGRRGLMLEEKKLPFEEISDHEWGNIEASRAVGDACKRNPIPIIIPCHRILSINEKIGRYSGGDPKTPDGKENINRKLWLINLETTHS